MSEILYTTEGVGGTLTVSAGTPRIYCLENAELTSSFPIGVSNEFIGKPATIGVESGTLLVMWQAAKEELPKIAEMI